MRRHAAAAKRKRKTPEQWLAAFEQMAAHFGGEGLKTRPRLKAAYLEQLAREGD